MFISGYANTENVFCCLTILPLHFQRAAILIYRAVGMTFIRQKVSLTLFGDLPLPRIKDSLGAQKIDVTKSKILQHTEVLKIGDFSINFLVK